MKRNEEVARDFVAGLDSNNEHLTSYVYMNGVGILMTYSTELGFREVRYGTIVFYVNPTRYSQTSSTHLSRLTNALSEAGYQPNGIWEGRYIGGLSRHEIACQVWTMGGVPIPQTDIFADVDE